MGNNTFTEQFADGTTLTQSQLETAFQSVQPNISNMALATTGSSSGQVLTSNGSNTAPSFQAVSDPLGPFAQRNYGLLASTSNGALKIYLKTHGNATPSAGSFVDITTSNNATSFATYTNIQVAAATSITVPQSATFGYLAGGSGNGSRIHVYGYISSGTTVFLAVSSRSDLDTGEPIATTAINASAKSNSVLYATASTTVIPRMLGYVDASYNASSQWNSVSHINVSNNFRDMLSLHRSNTPSSSADIGQIAISSTSGTASTTNTSATSITNMSITITTSGRPVWVGLLSDGSGSDGYLGAFSSTGGGHVEFVLVRDSTVIHSSLVGSDDFANNFYVPPSSVQQIDTGANAGTHTYTAKFSIVNSGTTARCYFAKLSAYEL